MKGIFFSLREMSGNVMFWYTCCEHVGFSLIPVLDLGKTKLEPGSESMSQALQGLNQDGTFYSDDWL
jgi:hypothetical protein